MAGYETFLEKIFPFIGNMLKAYEAEEKAPEGVEHHLFMDLEMTSSGKHTITVDGVEQELPNDFAGYFFKSQDIISTTAMTDINTFISHRGDLGFFFFAESLIFVPTSFTEESTYNDLICLPVVDMEAMSGIEYTDVFPTVVPGSMEPTGETISAQDMGFKKLHIKSYVNQEEATLKFWADFICID